MNVVNIIILSIASCATSIGLRQYGNHKLNVYRRSLCLDVSKSLSDIEVLKEQVLHN